MGPLAHRALGRIVDLRAGEIRSALLMFAYSFLAMTSYNIVRPLTRSKFIDELGSHNLPYVLLVAGVLIGVLMHGYSAAIRRLPRRWIVPIVQLAIAVLLVVFWALWRTGAAWVAVALYFAGLVLGVLLISQFWTVANEVYDARQAKRLFGFIGGGASLGGVLGGGITALAVERIGADDLLLVSAGVLAVCAGVVATIVRLHPARAGGDPVADESTVGSLEAFRLLASSPQLRVIALVIGMAASGAAIVDQQLNMAVDASREGTDAIAAFLARITVVVSMAGFVVQVGLTTRIHRSLGLAFALLLLPVALGSTAVVVLLTGTLWAAVGARVIDTTLRYTVDKTSREVLFVPLPPEVRHRTKPFVDVAVDRFAKAGTALLLLVLIQPWGLGLDWRRLSYASLTATAVWIGVAIVARREYLKAFRAGIGTHAIVPDTVRLDAADAATIETLVEELSNPDDASVLYAIEMLEALGKRRLVTPLLLHHDSPRVRARALIALQSTRRGSAVRWVAVVKSLLNDEDADVRAAAMRALIALGHEDAAVLMRRCLDDPEPRVAVTAAVALADSDVPADVDGAAATLQRLIDDRRDAAAAGRREAAAALAHVRSPRFRTLLVPLLDDRDRSVAEAAIRSARAMGLADGLFVPALVARLGDRALKVAAREALVGDGPDVLEALGYILRDRREHVWIRRHLPATIALIPAQPSMDVLLASLDDPDGFLRYKVLQAIETLHRAHPSLVFSRPPLERQVLTESTRYYKFMTLRHNLVREAPRADASLLVRALDDKMRRTLDRIYRLLGLLYSIRDVEAARQTIEHGEPRRRAAAIEYLDNLLGGAIRRHVLPIIEDAPVELKVRQANALLKDRPRDLDDTVAQLVHEDDPVVAAAAIQFVVDHELWSLTDDLEFVLARRSLDDPCVTTAALWAMACRGRTAAASATPGRLLTTVELATRLSAVPLFALVSVDELFRVADAGHQVRVSAGRPLADGRRQATVHFLLEGSVRQEGPGGETRLVRAPAALAVEELLGGGPPTAPLHAAEPLVCFTLDRTEFLTMLAHNSLLAQGLFRMLLVGHGIARPAYAPGMTAGALAARTFQPIEKMFLLRQHAWLERASLRQLSHLTRLACDVPLTAGQCLFQEGEPPSIYQVVQGEFLLESEATAPVVVRAGGTVGVAETLAGVPWPWRATVTQQGHALRLGREGLFEALADDVGLLEGILSTVVAAHTMAAKTDAG